MASILVAASTAGKKHFKLSSTTAKHVNDKMKKVSKETVNRNSDGR